jgi:hypothetical protein
MRTLVLSVLNLACLGFVSATQSFADDGGELHAEEKRRLDVEGPIRIVFQSVNQILDESEGRVPVGLHLQAQMYYLHRDNPEFEKYLNFIQEAAKSKRPLRVSFRTYSGRIIGVH